MSRFVKGIVAGGIVGAIAWAVREQQEAERRQAAAQVIPATTRAPETPERPNRAREALKGILGGVLGDLLDDAPVRTPSPAARPAPAPQRPQTAPAGQFRATGATGNVGPLLALIRKHESRGDYNAVWGRIRANDRPPKPLVSMTIAEVLAWQDSIDRKYMSEAAGAYQILEDTLRGLYRSAGLKSSDKFSVANQDKLAVALLNRRGLKRYRARQITDVAFAQSLAKEWASFPAQTVDKRGRPATGQSYYAGDGLNRSLTSKSDVLKIVRKI